MNSRRDFIKMAGLTGLGLAGSLKSFAAYEREMSDENLPRHIREYSQDRVQKFNMSGYCAPKLDTVRVGIVGLGNRGRSHLGTILKVSNVELTGLCDIHQDRVESDYVKKLLKEKKQKPKLYFGSRDVWKDFCEDPNIDLIIITTPTYMHAEMAMYAMECGKHAASEVPAAVNIEDCWGLVETAERTRKQFIMLENYNYMEFQLVMLNMARKGFFGDIVHGEGAYNTSKMRNNFNKNMYWNMWWLRLYANRKGNLYPTHGIGPIHAIMDINRGDCFDFLVSVESDDFMMGKKAMELSLTDDFFKTFVGMDYRGNMNVTTIKTKKGRTIMLQHDATTPSPQNLIHGVYGTKGAAVYDPAPPKISKGEHRWVGKEEFDALKKEYTPEITLRMREFAKNSGHGGSDIQEMWRLIDCLRNGFPLEWDVYDAASMSCILPLSEWSVLHRSNSIDIPDFTAGSWKTNSRNLDINLTRVGNTKVIY